MPHDTYDLSMTFLIQNKEIWTARISVSLKSSDEYRISLRYSASMAIHLLSLFLRE